jgi:hypothetical protein
MPDHCDPVDRALQSLGRRLWPGAAHDPELEQKLMESFAIRKSTTFLGRHRVLVSAGTVLALATAGLAAAGGLRLIRSWFATVSVDGQVVHTGEVVPDENGQAMITLPEGALPKGGEHRLNVTLEGNAAEPGKATTVTVTGGTDGLTVQTSNPPESTAETTKK